MPQFEPKEIQKQLDQESIWPVYWLVGEERLKARELIKRIGQTLGVEKGSLEYETIAGNEVPGGEIVDRASTLSFGGGVRFLVISDAEKIKEPEAIEILFGNPQKKADLITVVVGIAQSLDQRKKFSKKLVDKAAVVSCEAVSENDREAWVKYLAKRRTLTLSEAEVAVLRMLDPWSLDGVDQELGKAELAASPEDRLEILCSGGISATTDQFMDAFFQRKKDRALAAASSFIHDPETALPLLGLLAWNARMLLTPTPPKGSFLQARLGRWKPHWKVEQLKKLQSQLFQVDYSLKQTPKPSLGVWNEFILEALASSSS